MPRGQLSQPTLTPAEFAAKWRGVTTTEKASSQSHFIDLCRMLGEPTPHDADPTGEQYAFERRVTKAGGGEGFADVWKRDFFAWECETDFARGMVMVARASVLADPADDPIEELAH
jgi:hypothetical protein